MRTTFLIILTVVTSTTFGQIFEGRILYENSYKSKNPNVTDQQWISMMGSTQEYFIKEGDYKSIMNGTLVQWQLYINKENKIYTKMSNSEKALWNDASIQGDEVLKSELNKNVTEVLGFKCDEIILTCKSGLQKYYFSSHLKVETNLYSNHKFGNWFEYLSKSNALPLKLIIETAQFTMEGIATSINPTKLERTLFEIPIGIKTEKSPY
jgi:hypothetical protein